MAKVKGLSGTSISQPWEVITEFDFTGASNHTFSDGVAHSYGGVDWTCQNLANFGTSIKFINGTGLEIVVNGADTNLGANWYYLWMNCPVLSASVDDIVSDYDASDTLCFQAILTSSIGGSFTPGDGQYGGSFLVMTDGGWGPDPATLPSIPGDATGHWTSVGMYNNGDADHTLFYTRSGGTTGATAGPLHSQDIPEQRFPTFYEQVFLPACTTIMSAATTGSGGGDITKFPDPLEITQFRSSAHKQQTYSYQISNMPGGTGNAAPSYDLRPTNLKVGLSSRVYDASLPATMNFTTVFTKLRVLRRPRYDL